MNAHKRLDSHHFGVWMAYEWRMDGVRNQAGLTYFWRMDGVRNSDGFGVWMAYETQKFDVLLAYGWFMDGVWMAYETPRQNALFRGKSAATTPPICGFSPFLHSALTRIYTPKPVLHPAPGRPPGTAPRSQRYPLIYSAAWPWPAALPRPDLTPCLTGVKPMLCAAVQRHSQSPGRPPAANAPRQPRGPIENSLMNHWLSQWRTPRLPAAPWRVFATDPLRERWPFESQPSQSCRPGRSRTVALQAATGRLPAGLLPGTLKGIFDRAGRAAKFSLIFGDTYDA